jgi:DNA modification methylase
MTDFWESPNNETVQVPRRLTSGGIRSQDVSSWLRVCHAEAPISSGQGVAELPFQRWFHFKEAFSPKFVANTLGSLPYKITTCLDPFGGCGTTALTCRMLGMASTSIEVNPFLADLIESKVSPVVGAKFSASYDRMIRRLRITERDKGSIRGMPPTLKEPGLHGRYVFNADVYQTIRALIRSSESLPPSQARLLRVLLGSTLISNSNVVINGKGRRYRRGEHHLGKTGADLIESLDLAVGKAITDLSRFSGLPRGSHRVLRGDARTQLARVERADVAVFSPPYPNSFDYTDVYNLELWMLGYLKSSKDNTLLRHRTLRSHVQIKWRPTPKAARSATLDRALTRLRHHRGDLWNRHIPEMIGYYFDDLYDVFRHLARILAFKRHVIVAIGDSQYAGVRIDVAATLVESVSSLGFRLVDSGAIRSMRNSPQHGGEFELSEHCLVFQRM